MDIKDVEVGKSYRFVVKSFESDTVIEEGIILVEKTDDDIWPITGKVTHEGDSRTATGTVTADELIEEV